MKVKHFVLLLLKIKKTLKKPVTSTHLPFCVCVNPAVIPTILLAGEANEMLSHAWLKVQSISSTLIHFCCVSVELDTKWRHMGNFTYTAEQNGRGLWCRSAYGTSLKKLLSFSSQVSYWVSFTVDTRALKEAVKPNEKICLGIEKSHVWDQCHTILCSIRIKWIRGATMNLLLLICCQLFN